ncbi:MAG TPA: MBL fold metallo-hydrolase [Pyrinomonadaceae bacterium]|nr:MBL fold metallo-hydrolase [Acidobacteriota bacterium]HQZ96206.1 MBL fold metallo-hydrolase [Pyrinomonadaceae bacterium]
MLVEKFIITPFQQNTRVIVCEETRKAICVDPGEPCEEIVDFLNKNKFELQAVTLTHGHLDHVGGTSYLAKMFPKAEIILHSADEGLYYSLPQQPLLMGVQPHQLAALGLDYDDPPKLTRNWQDGEIYEVGSLRFSVRHCPGHTPGHVVFAEESQKRVFVGDCLFLGSVGRTDLPGGDHDQLIDSITTNILSLDDETVVYSGHGPETTVGHERQTNPFLTGAYQIGKGRYY